MFITSCAHLFYHPHSGLQDSSNGVWFKTSDGNSLYGRFLYSKLPQTKGIVIHFHGNAGNLDSHIAFVDWFSQRGYDVFMFDYRGFGKSEGKSSRFGLFLDSQAAMDYVLGLGKWQKVYVFGQSLGGNQALSVLSVKKQKKISAVVIDSTFYSYASVANDFLGGTFLTYPLTWCLVGGNCYSAKDSIGKVEVPILIIHGDRDQIIDISHSYDLFQMANFPKEFIGVRNCRHIEAVKQKIVRDDIVSFFDKY